MTVSVIIPCYNCKEFVFTAIESILAQSFGDIEVIVVDDGSYDGSAQIILEKFGASVRVVSQPNKGAAAARNFGANIAQGHYLLFHDSDDYLGERFIEGLVAASDSVKSNISFGDFALVWPDGRTVECSRDWLIDDVNLVIAGVLSDQWVSVHAVLWTADFFWRIGGWKEDLSANDDGELLLRALIADPTMARSHLDRAIYRQHDGVRISNIISIKALASQVSVLEYAVSELADRMENRHIQHSLSRTSYEMARKLFELGHNDLGERCIEIWKKLGPPFSRTGTRNNIIGTAMFGFKLKAILARRMRKFFQILNDLRHL